MQNDTTAIEILPELVDNFAANILAYAVLLAAIATITMALLELVKAVARLRLIYHRGRVRRWVGGNQRCYEELLILTVSEVASADALFDQPTDKMMGQVQSAANVVLDFPDLYPEMYRFLTSPPDSPAAARETGGSGRTAGEPPDADVWREFAARLEAPPPAEAGGAAAIPGVERATRARARLDHFVTRKLDAFQTRTEYIWARANQWAAVVGGGIFIAVLLYRAGFDTTIPQTILLAAFGGMLAPFAKDVVTALSGLRTRVT